jgi:hypothetical protein
MGRPTGQRLVVGTLSVPLALLAAVARSSVGPRSWPPCGGATRHVERHGRGVHRGQTLRDFDPRAFPYTVKNAAQMVRPEAVQAKWSEGLS